MNDKPPILFIDDELAVIESYLELAEEEFEVFTAQTVEKGLEILAQREIAVIVTDMRMPGQDGADFLRIANSTHRKPIKIMLSAYVSEFFDDAFQTEFRPFAILRKPLMDPKEFLRVLHEAAQEYEFRFGEDQESEKGFLSATQVLKRLGVSKPTLYKYLKEGLPSKRVGGRRLFKWDEIEKWVQHYERKHPHE